MRRRTWLLFWLGLWIPAAAAAQTESEDDEAASASKPAASPYMVAIRKGMELAVGGNLTEATATLTEAIRTDSAGADAHYILAEVYRLSGSLGAALQSFRTAAHNAQQTGDIYHQLRSTHGVAATLERQDEVEVARTEWNDLISLANAHNETVAAEVGRARIEAIDRIQQLESTYLQVRERIQARKQAKEQP